MSARSMFTLSNFSEDDNYIDLMLSFLPASVMNHEVILYMILTLIMHILTREMFQILRATYLRAQISHNIKRTKK